jgi:hypothetical protein
MSQASPLTSLVEARHDQGYSCSQTVFSLPGEKLGVDPALCLRIAAGFGGGLSRSGGACGCVTGAVMAIGLLQPDIFPAGQPRSQGADL